MAADKKTSAADAAKPNDGVGTLAKCCSCATEQPTEHKCCAECGTPMAKTSQIALDTALAELGAFHKANTELAPKPDVESGDHAHAEDVMAKSRATAADPNEIAVVELLIGGQTINSDQLVTLLGEQRATRIGVGQLAGLMVKAFHAGFAAHEERVMAKVDAMTAAFEEWRDQPGRSRAIGLVGLAKSLHTPTPTDQQDDSLRGDLLIKAAIGLGEGKKIEPLDVTLTSQYATSGHSLATIATLDPALSLRLAAAGLQAAA